MLGTAFQIIELRSQANIRPQREAGRDEPEPEHLARREVNEDERELAGESPPLPSDSDTVFAVTEDTKVFASKDMEITYLKQTIKELTAAIAERDKTISERDAEVGRLQRKLGRELEHELETRKAARAPSQASSQPQREVGRDEGTTSQPSQPLQPLGSEEEKLGEPLPRHWYAWNDAAWGLGLHVLQEHVLDSVCTP